MKKIINTQLDKSLLFPVVAAFILLTIVFLLAFLAFRQSQAPAPPPSLIIKKITPQPISVDRVIPSSPNPLTPGLPYSFHVYFKGAVPDKYITFSLTARDIYAKKPVIPVKIIFRQLNENTFVVKTDVPVHAESEYVLEVLYKDESIFTKGFLTNDVLEQEKKAVTAIETLRDVQNIKDKIYGDSKFVTEIDSYPSSKEDYYVIHAYELVPNADGTAHSATFGWYRYYPQTGIITKQNISQDDRWDNVTP